MRGETERDRERKGEKEIQEEKEEMKKGKKLFTWTLF